MKIFKVLMAFIFIFLFLNCSGEQEKSEKTVVITETPEQPEVPENDIIKISLWTGEKLDFYDGNEIFTWASCVTRRAESQIYSHEDILYFLGEYGETVDVEYLCITPDFISLDSSENIWIIKNIDPVESYENGSFPCWHTKVFLNNVEYGTWQSRDWKTEELVISENNVYTRGLSGGWRCVNNELSDIVIVQENFVVHNFDSTLHTATINETDVSWTNFFNAARHWLKLDNTWYSQNGYTFDGTTLNEYGSVLTDWRTRPYITGYTQGPVLISAGIYLNKLYYIECNSGWVIEYNPRTNIQQLYLKIYNGDGLRETGLFYQPLLNQVIVENYLYFIYDAQYYRTNLDTKLTSHFVSGISKIYKY